MRIAGRTRRELLSSNFRGVFNTLDLVTYRRHVMNAPSPPRYLTLTELVLNFALCCALGAWMAGWTGAFCGVGVITLVYFRSIWISVRSTGSYKNRADRP